MSTFGAPDGTTLSYTLIGDGTPVVCLPGGPMQDAAYLGDLGGLSDAVQLIRLDLRGTGSSAVPPDPQSYRCDRQVDDVESLRLHLGLERLALLAHSAGANLAVRYAERFPDRVDRLALITPSVRAIGLNPSADQRREVVELRADEPWYPDAAAAFDRLQTGEATEDDWRAITPFTYGRWDDAARAHAAACDGMSHDDAAAVFTGEDAFDPPTTRAALAELDAPVLVLTGELDVSGPPRVLAELARLVGNPHLVVQPGAGHFPWLDDAIAFNATVAPFLR